MLKIYYRNTTPVFIRPTPLISISHSPNKNKMGTVGCTYNITLTGTIIAHDGSPVFNISDVNNNSSILSSFNNFLNSGITPHYNPDIGDRLHSIVEKQNTIRNLFSQDHQKIEIVSLNESNKCIVFYPTVLSVDFEEGLYIETCRYSITLEAPLLFDGNNNVYTEGLIGSTFTPVKFDLQRSKDNYLRETDSYTTTTISGIISRWGGIVEDFSDTWSLETDESNGQTSNLSNNPLSYRVTRNVSAVGKNVYYPDFNMEPWEHAVGFIKKTILEEPQASPTGGGYEYDESKLEQYPGFRFNDNRITSKYSKDILDLPSFYRGYNHLRTVNIDKSAGSCSISDSWILASGQSHLENYTISVNSSLDNIFTNVKIDGTIKGLSDLPASGYIGSRFNVTEGEDKTPYKKALNKYFEISNSGKFGVGSILYTRANNAIPQVLNSQPLSISLGTNEVNGEITYSIEFDDRPYNYFTDVVAENITINDTYPGDVFAVIPVIGRKTGPILQYIKGRTEYKRNVNIEILLDYTDIAYQNNRNNLLLTKPILNEPIKTELKDLIRQLSPKDEPFVSGYFLNPPVESWSPKDGRYTLSLSWDYQKSR